MNTNSPQDLSSHQDPGQTLPDPRQIGSVGTAACPGTPSPVSAPAVPARAQAEPNGHPDKTTAEYLDTTEFLILEDGRILVHNLTPEFARLLLPLVPHDALLQQRATSDPKS